MKHFLLTLALLSLPAHAIAPNDPVKPVETKGDDNTSSSAGYHNTELSSAGPTTDFGSTIIREEREDVIRARKAQEAKKKKNQGK